MQDADKEKKEEIMGLIILREVYEMGLIKPKYYGSSKIIKQRSYMSMAMETPGYVKRYGMEAAKSIMQKKIPKSKIKTSKRKSRFSHSILRRVW